VVPAGPVLMAGAAPEAAAPARPARKTFRALSAEVVHQISVLQRLKVLAKERAARNLDQVVPQTEDMEAALPTQLSASASSGGEEDEEGEEIARSKSEPALPTESADIPNWLRSLSTKQELERRSRNAKAAAAAAAAARTAFKNWRDKIGARVVTDPQCLCDKAAPALAPAPTGKLMCKRHALRNLWKRFFLSRTKASNLKKHPEAADLADLGNLLCQGVECFQPSGTVEGKEEVLKALRCYGDTNVQVELVHNCVDEEASVTFSEYVIEFPRDQTKKHLRVCEVVQWELSGFRAHPSAGSDLYDKNAVLGNKIEAEGEEEPRHMPPCIEKIAIFGKGMSLVPNDRLPIPLDSRTHSEADLGTVVTEYVKALLCNDYEAIYGMCCSNFRISAIDGVKTRDSFVSWLRTLRTTSGFERTVREVFVDHKSKTAFLQQVCTCDSQSALVVNVVQWDLDFKCIINIREYGAGFGAK